MILKVIAFPLILFIPGFLLYNLLTKDKMPVNLFEALFINISASLLISGWTGLILAELGYFSLMNLVMGLGFFSFMCIILISKLKRKLSFKNLTKPKVNYKSIILIIILLAAVKLFFLPGENITLNQDDVVIVNHGVSIAHTGSVFGHDPIPNKVKNKNLFYDFRQKKYLFPGFGFYFNEKTERIAFYYLDFYPVLLAVFYLIFGVKFFLYLTSLLALLSIISVYAAVKHLFSWEVGLLSSLFLTFSFPQIWFARYPCAEILTQFFIFSGLLMIILMLEHKKPFFAFFSGFIFSTLMLVRLDSLLTAWAFVIFIILLQFTKKLKPKMFSLLSLSFIIPYCWSLMHNYIFDKPYIIIPSKFTAFIKIIFGAEFPGLHLTSFLLFYGSPVLLFMAAILIQRYTKIIPKLHSYIPDFNWKKIHYISPLLITVPFIILYLTRYPYSDGLISQKQTLLIIQSFLTPVGLLLSIIGLVIIAHNHLLNPYLLKHKKTLSILCFLLISIPHFIYYIFLSLHNQPVFPWGFRRYIPIIYPFFIICLSYTLIKIFKYQFHSRLKPSIKLKSTASKIVAFGLIGFLFVSMLFQGINSGLLTHREFEGLIKDTKLLSSYFDRKSIILFFPISFLTGVSAPLKYIFNKNTILLPKLEANDDFFRQIALWKSNNRSVYIASSNPGLINNRLSENCKLILRLRFPINFPKMNYVGKPGVGDHLYGNISEYKQNLHIFEIQSPTFNQENKIKNSGR